VYSDILLTKPRSEREREGGEVREELIDGGKKEGRK